MKKLASRGFTLVELMIVIAIIGILAAVLYPALTGYFERSRDTNRQGALRNVSLALSSYNIDNSQYPKIEGGSSAKCIDSLKDKIVGIGGLQTLPKDPRKGFGVDGCHGENQTGYGYQTIKLPNETSENGNAYVLSAHMEIKGNANFDGSKWTGTDLTLGKDDLANANTKGTLSGTVESTHWYYVVAQ